MSFHINTEKELSVEHFLKMLQEERIYVDTRCSLHLYPHHEDGYTLGLILGEKSYKDNIKVLHFNIRASTKRVFIYSCINNCTIYPLFLEALKQFISTTNPNFEIVDKS